MTGVSRRLTTPLRVLYSARRCYGAAAAAQPRYDFDDYGYDDDDDGGWGDRRRRRNHPQPMADGEGSQPERGVQWVILGEPGSKKHVYAEWLSKLLQVPHISMGSLIRQELNPPGSALYKKMESAVNQGKLVPEDIIFELLSKRLEQGCRKGESGFILDGIPRTQIQAFVQDG
ncbi:hypothetical protein Dimus_015842 [Dionaea muscipula]